MKKGASKSKSGTKSGKKKVTAKGLRDLASRKNTKGGGKAAIPLEKAEK